MSTFFPNAQNFSIDGGTFSIVHGDQHNNYRQRISQASEASISNSSFAHALGPVTQATSSSTTTTTIQINGNQYNQVIQRKERVHTEFDDFRNVKRSDIYKIRNICQFSNGVEGCKCEACRRDVVKTFCTAKLIGVEGEFTTVTYSGQDAHKIFEEEFFELSRKQFSEASQIFAIANGTIPSMVLWHNLIPLVQFKGNVGRLGLRYLERLRKQLSCQDEELWIDSSRGVICHGPKGPSSSIPEDELELGDLPPTTELLQEEVLVRFLASHKSQEADDAFMTAINDTWSYEDVPERVNRATIFLALTKTPIAVANNVWKSVYDNLVERMCLENGWTSYGCRYAWHTKSYNNLHQYQIARGFDPTTADFARHLGYGHIFQPLDDSDRFEDIHEGDIPACSAVPINLNKSTITIHSEPLNPTTANFTQHLANDNYIFQPLNVNDQFKEVNKGAPEFSASYSLFHLRAGPGIGSSASHATRSLASAGPEGPSTTQDPGLVANSTLTVDLQAMEDDNSMTHSRHVIAHKPQETDSRMGTLNVSVQVPPHKSGTTSNDDPTLNGEASCPVTPRSLDGGPTILIQQQYRNRNTAVADPPDRPPTSQRNQCRLIKMVVHQEDNNAASSV
ncbi:hypothetical protein PQX77_013738 [Marasmius sp. AFHP31]|nr:hypothetical protein PQX77_013738 [Marasmius sp. AFHP31]